MLNQIAEIYRRAGPLQLQIPVRAFLDLMDRTVLETALADLLDSGALVAGEAGTVTLAPILRAQVATHPVVTGWLNSAHAAPAHLREPRLRALRAEFKVLRGTCSLAGGELIERAVDFSALLATAELDPWAIDVVRRFDRAPERLLREVSAIPEGSCHSPRELEVKVRHHQGTFMAGGRY